MGPSSCDVSLLSSEELSSRESSPRLRVGRGLCETGVTSLSRLSCALGVLCATPTGIEVGVVPAGVGVARTEVGVVGTEEGVGAIEISASGEVPAIFSAPSRVDSDFIFPCENSSFTLLNEISLPLFPASFPGVGGGKAGVRTTLLCERNLERISMSCL